MNTPFFRASVVALTLGGLFASGCGKDPSKDVPAAKVEEPKPEPAKVEAPKADEPKAAEPAAAASPVAAPAAASPAAAEAPIPGLPLSGTIQAVGSKVTGSHTIDFKKWRGGVELADGKAEGGKLQFEVQMAELECDAGNRNAFTEKLEGHLKAPDFFDVGKFATAAFVSSEIKAGGDPAAAGSTHTIKGNLTLRGTTKEVTFPATVAVNGKDLTAKTEFSINRKDFGIEYPGKPDDLIRDGVVLKIDLKATLP